jgi:hypothetical protein
VQPAARQGDVSMHVTDGWYALVAKAAETVLIRKKIKTGTNSKGAQPKSLSW